MKWFIGLLLLSLWLVSFCYAANTTQIIVVLDRSGSMEDLQEEVVGGFNRFLVEQQSRSDYAEMSLIQFDDLYQQDYLNTPIRDCKELVLHDSYQPRGWTALYDAIGKTINSISVTSEKVLFVIITDGQENRSSEFDLDSIKNLIQEKEDSGWDFVFLGVGLDAFAESSSVGLRSQDSLQIDPSEYGITVMYDTLTNYVNAVRASGSISTSDTDLDINDFVEEK